ncbi:hypothetical protein [Flavobacterium aquiphilum]|uniref:hypothetical protein n=1 Tax=Flavobacterium aquiphilum TaxID=3003261 RepID=UPI00247FBC1D|nr:hypothetical protein [Flavobacterium aquiphilum]
MIKTTIITILFFGALYFGSGGFIVLDNEQQYEKALTLQKKEILYKNIRFYNKEVMESAKQQDLILDFYPYYDRLPSALNFIITAICFGIIGSIGKIINDSIKNETLLHKKTNLLLIPCQGGIIGLIILGVSYTIPVILTSENVTLKPITVVFLSLFSGIFYENFYQWFLKNLNDNVFKQ